VREVPRVQVPRPGQQGSDGRHAPEARHTRPTQTGLPREVRLPQDPRPDDDALASQHARPAQEAEEVPEGEPERGLHAAPPLVVTRQPDLMFSEVIAIASPLSWHEAVAFAREYLLSSHERSLVEPTATLLTAHGEMHTEPGAVPLAHPVRAVAELLTKVLPPDAPASLHALAAEEAGPAPRRRTPQELAQALAFFERPNRRADLAALWARADTALTAQRTLRRLAQRQRQDVREEAAPLPAQTRAWWSWRDVWAQNYAIGAVVCGILAVGSSAWLLVALTGGSRPLPPLEARGVPRVLVSLPTAPLRARVRSSWRNVLAYPDASVTEVRPLGPQPVATVGVTDSSALTGAKPSSDTADGTDAWVVTLRELVPERGTSAGTTPSGLATARASASSRIYTAADADVVPAALRWPRMSLDVATDPSSLESVLRLTIDERGRVERVRLISPGNSFNDRMLLAAAKAWAFHPARLGQQAVRYQLDVRLKQ